MYLKIVPFFSQPITIFFSLGHLPLIGVVSARDQNSITCPDPYPLLTSVVFSQWRMEGGAEGAWRPKVAAPPKCSP